MTKKRVNYIWQKQSFDSQCETINCSVYDPIKDFHRDPTGCYVLIRPDYATKIIEVAICDKDHKILMIFRGSKCQDLYECIFKYENKNTKHWFKDRGHMAYLGKELKMAELAISSGSNDYCQE